jgi:REP element-mobilizing transposase RayT
VPSRLKRFYGHHDLHFITWSCYGRKPLLGTAQRRDLLLQVLEQMRQRYRFVAVGYVVMPEHVHLLISKPEHGTPSTVVQAIKLGFARRVLGSRKVAVADTSRGVPHVSRVLRDVGNDHQDVSADEIVHNRGVPHVSRVLRDVGNSDRDGLANDIVQNRWVPHVSRFLRDVGNDHRDVSTDDIVHNRIWQRRLYDFNVWTDRKRIQKMRYIHRIRSNEVWSPNPIMGLEQFSRLPVRRTGPRPR